MSVSLERRIGIQLELANLHGLLIPNYSDTHTLYNTDCVERMIHHFVSSEPSVTSASPSLLGIETASPSGRWRRVSKLVDNYIAEVASDVNLKPRNIRLFAKALPNSSRSLHDGLYRALDIFFKAHPWLSNYEQEKLCSSIDFLKLSTDACTHASQNNRLPLREVLQILFVEHLKWRTSLAGFLHALDVESAPSARVDVPSESTQAVGWATLVRENRVQKGDMERMRSRVGELEEEFSKIKEEMERMSKSQPP